MSTSTTGTRLAMSSLRKAGLLERDETMRDAADKPGGRKGATKTRSHRTRDIDMYKQERPGPSSRLPMLANRDGPSNRPLTIHGASRTMNDRRVKRTGQQDHIVENGIVSRARPAPLNSGTIDLLRTVIRRRYNADARFLDLENLSADGDIVKHGLQAPGNQVAIAKHYAVIFKIAAELRPEVQTLSLANSNISTGHTITALSRYLPGLSNLSLQGNRLDKYRDIDYFVGRKGGSAPRLDKLKELIFVGNPLVETETKAGRQDQYKYEIARRIPSLEMLDGFPVVRIAFDAPAASTSRGSGDIKPPPKVFPCEMQPSFITGIDGAIVSNFLGRFFNAYDTQRVALQPAYHPAATFSFSANTSIPHRSRMQGFQHSKEMPNQTSLEWAPYLNNGSRNLERIAANQARAVGGLCIGPESILGSLTKLPSTVHDVAGAPEKFCVDAWPCGAGDTMTLFVNVHGQFKELPSEGVRSFDRSFILAPAATDTPARAAGWDVVILSDQLCIRAYSSHEAWAPGPMRVQAGDPLPPLDQLAPIPEPQRTLVVQVSQRTGLNVKFSVDCLEMNEWDPDRAVAKFEEVKSTLGKDAYL